MSMPAFGSVREQPYAERYTRVFGGVFLNVLKCSNDGFYDSISRELLLNLDYDGKRVLTVFTQLDSSSDAVIPYITSPKFSNKNPFGFFFVKDDDKKNDEKKEGSKKRPSSSSKFSADKVGFGSISKNLVLAMLSVLFHRRSLVVLKIESDLRELMEELDGYKKLGSVGEAMPTITTVFEKALVNLSGLYETDEYGRYRDETSMHVDFDVLSRIQVFKRSMKEMQVNNTQPFLFNELELLRNRAVPKPTSFVPSHILKSLVEDQFCYAHLVIEASVSRVMTYIEQVFSRLLTDTSKQYVHIHQYLKTLGNFWIKELEKKFNDKLQKLFDLEKRSVFTCIFDFDEKVKMVDLKFELDKDDKIIKAKLGEVEFNVNHFAMYSREELNKALELKQILLAYWDCIIERCGDYWAMHLLDSLREMASVDAMSGFKAKHMSNGANDKRELPKNPNFLAEETNLKNRVECIEKALEEMRMLQFEFPV